MAINVSNPTSATGRTTAAELLRERFYFLRQDLSYIKRVAGAPDSRMPRSTLPAVPPSAKREMLQERNALIEKTLPRYVAGERLYPLPLHPDGAVPCCTLRVNGEGIRPHGVKLKGNAVMLTRTFGSRPGHPPLNLELDALLATLPADLVREALLTHVYTPGTVEGFDKRLGMITSQTTKSIYKVLPKGTKACLDRLEKLLPVDLTKLPDWNGGDGDLLEMLQTVSITGHASAGAPYWRKKKDCMEQIFYVVEHVVNAMKDGKLDELLKAQPELFVIECKNKTDRYEFSKLQDKTRPYFNPPAHFSLLASFLFQGLSKALYRVGGDRPTCNAYGWSAAHGGIGKLVDDVKRRKERGERGWCYVYGDDGDLYFVSGGGLYRVSPDVKQMDSCVDFDTIKLTFEYMRYMYTRACGESRLWDMIIMALVELMEKPRIMVSGTKLYTKDPNGLMSGIVGTTVFDTVKAAVSYTDLLESHASNPAALLDEAYVAKLMLERYGLVLKPGTWQPELVNLDPPPAYMSPDGDVTYQEESLFGRGKFLGVQYLRVSGPRKPDWVPWLPEADWASCLLAPRQGEEESGATERLRTQFDRIRGYLTTGAVFQPRIRQALDYWVDRIPSEIILMQPQGTTPPEGVLFGDDQETWEYPTPEFYPHAQWVFDVYADPDNTYGTMPEPMFAEHVMEAISELRLKNRKVRLEYNKKTETVEILPPTPSPPLEIGVDTTVVEVKEQKLTSHWQSKPPLRATEAPQEIPLTGTPYDLAYTQTEVSALKEVLLEAPPPPYMPSQGRVCTLREARNMVVDERPAEVSVMHRTGKEKNSLVHPPTPGGVAQMYIPGEVTLLQDFLSPHLQVPVAIPPSLSPSEATAKILNSNRLEAHFKISVVSQSPAVVEGRLQVYHLEYADGKTIKGEPRVMQLWKGPSQKAIKFAFAAWVCVQNKKISTQLLQQAAERDWSIGAEKAVVPFSEFPNDSRPPPPPSLLNPLCPATVPIELASGRLTVGAPPESAPTFLMPKLPEVPPTPEGPPTLLPRGLKPPPPPIERRPRVGAGAPLSVSSDEDDYEEFQNAVLIDSEEEGLPRYVPKALLEEVFRSAGIWNSRESPLKYHKNNDRQIAASLKRMLIKVQTRYKHASKKKDKAPAKVPPQPSKAPERAQKSPSKEARNDDRSRRPRGDGGNRGSGGKQRNSRARNRPPLVENRGRDR